MQTWYRTYRNAGPCDPAQRGWVAGKGKPLVEDGVVPEIAVRNELAARPGWDAVWVRKGVGTGLHFWRTMPSNLADHTCGETSLPKWPTSVLDTIKPDWRRLGGVLDVFAWSARRRQVLFAEAKWRRKDQLRPNQIAFIEAGVAAGYPEDSFVVVEWDYEGMTPSMFAPRE